MIAILVSALVGAALCYGGLRLAAWRRSTAEARTSAAERERRIGEEASRKRDEERRDMFAGAGARLSVVAQHPGFKEIRRSKAGVFSVGLAPSTLLPLRWFESSNVLEALDQATAAIREQREMAAGGQVVRLVRP